MDQKPYPAEKARGGEIILNTPARRAIFLTGLIGAVVLAVVLMIVRRLPGIARSFRAATLQVRERMGQRSQFRLRKL